MTLGRIAPVTLMYVLLGLPQIQAATIQASSCSRLDVQSAINSASDGDTVLVPAGTCSWTATIHIKTGITVQGVGIDATIINDNVPDGRTVLIDTASGRSYRLTGFTFRRGSVTKGLTNGIIQVQGDTKAWRIDNNKFDNVDARAISVWGSTFGVIDHNQFVVSSGTIAIEVNHPTWNNSSYGDGSWSDDSYFGTEKFIFIEDNVFTPANQSSKFFAVDSDAGGRYVFRFNKVTNGNVNSHGTESGGRRRGVRAYEVYGNTFTKTAQLNSMPNVAMFRAGTGVVYNNVVGPGYNNFVALRNFRSWDTFQHWPACDGSSPYDLNDGIVYNQGTHNGASGALALTDTTKNWTPNHWSNGGFSVRNVTKKWGSYAVSNTATSIAVQPETHGDQQFFEPGDTYQILRATRCLDQIGSGKGALLSGIPPEPLAWPNQVIDPLYLWNNSLSGGVARAAAAGNPHIAEGRDYFNETVKPGYTPYTYPHPLVDGTPSPSPPTNLQLSGN